MYVGYLQYCDIYADLDGDNEQDEDEPTGRTAGWGQYYLTVDDADKQNAKIIVLPGEDCVDRCG